MRTLVFLENNEGAVRLSSTEPCDMKNGPCACGSWHDDENPPSLNVLQDTTNQVQK